MRIFNQKPISEINKELEAQKKQEGPVDLSELEDKIKNLETVIDILLGGEDNGQV